MVARWNTFKYPATNRKIQYYNRTLKEFNLMKPKKLISPSIQINLVFKKDVEIKATSYIFSSYLHSYQLLLTFFFVHISKMELFFSHFFIHLIDVIKVIDFHSLTQTRKF